MKTNYTFTKSDRDNFDAAYQTLCDAINLAGASTLPARIYHKLNKAADILIDVIEAAAN